MFNFQKMMKQAQEMQFKLAEIQEKMKDIEVSAESGGGLVKITTTCAGKVTKVSIDETLLNDRETLEDLIAAAMNNANEIKDERIKTETQEMMQELGLPGGVGQLPI